MSTAVIIARFQTPYLHQGHLSLLSEVKAKHNKLIVLLGISPVPGTRKNPFDYHTREKMIKREYPEIVVLPITDEPSDEKWSAKLDDLLQSSFPTESFLLYGSRDSFIPHYKGRYETIELPKHGEFNATELRERYADKVFDSKDFRAGILYAYHNQYTKVHATVDVAVFRNDRTDVLLGKKPSNLKWRLIGGFSDPEDDSFEVAAKRELQEECGPIEVGEMKYELSKKVADWRYRSEADKIITTLFSCDYIFGTPTAQDDIIEVKWVPLTQLTQMMEREETTPEHTPLFKHLIDKYQK